MPSPQDRPLSPHVAIYRWQFTNGLSILHRMTGVALAFGLIPLVLWLYAVAYDAALYADLQACFAHILGKLAMFGWTVAFFYHLGNGMRHLNWDTGRGFKLDEAASSGFLVVVFTISMSLFTWIFIAKKTGML